MKLCRVLGPSAFCLTALAFVLIQADSALADRVGLFKNKDGVSVRYTVVTPFPYVRTKEYPAIIAFAGGRQDGKAVAAAVSDYWGAEGRKWGYFVFLPEAPKGYAFYQKGAFLAPDLIEHFKSKYNVKGEKFHMAGNSNGGLSAFRIALKNRKRIQSLTVFPGFPTFTRDFHRLTRLKNIKVNLFVNAADERWSSMTKFTHERLKALGIDVTFQEFGDNGHKVKALTGANAKLLYDTIER